MSRKTLALIIVSVLLLIALIPRVLTQENDKVVDKGRKALVKPGGSGGTIVLKNGILKVAIENERGYDGVGTYTVATDVNHPTPDQDVFFDGAIEDPWSTYTTIHVVSTKRDYITSTDTGIEPSISGYTVVLMDDLGPTIVLQTDRRVMIKWTTDEGLEVYQDIELLGTTVEDTKVRVSVYVRNNNNEPLVFGIRYEWDIMIDGEDGSWFRPWTDINTPGTWTNVETQYDNPQFVFWETTNDPASPVLFEYGSVSEPSTPTPPPTPPDNITFAAWGSYPSPGLYDYTWNFTVQGRTIAGSGLDSAVAYFWMPKEIAPGEWYNVTAYLFGVSPTPAPTMPSVGGKVEAQLPVRGAKALIALFAVLAILAALVAIRRLS